MEHGCLGGAPQKKPFFLTSLQTTTTPVTLTNSIICFEIPSAPVFRFHSTRFGCSFKSSCLTTTYQFFQHSVERLMENARVLADPHSGFPRICYAKKVPDLYFQVYVMFVFRAVGQGIPSINSFLFLSRASFSFSLFSILSFFRQQTQPYPSASHVRCFITSSISIASSRQQKLCGCFALFMIFCSNKRKFGSMLAGERTDRKAKNTKCLNSLG